MDENIKKFIGNVSAIVDRLESLGWKEASFWYDAQSFGDMIIKFYRGNDNLIIAKDRGHWEFYINDKSEFVASNPALKGDNARQDDFVQSVLQQLAS